MKRQNSIVVFDGNLECDRFSVVSHDFEGDIVIHGSLMVKGDVIFNGRLWVDGEIVVKGELEVSSITSNCIDCYGLRAQDVYCDGDIRTSDIVVGGDLQCTGCISNDATLDVLGNVSCKEFSSGDTNISGNLTTTEGSICVNNLTVGGYVICEEYIDADNANVGNNVYCQGDFKINYDDVYIGGNLSCQGDFKVDYSNVYIAGNLSCQDIYVYGRDLEFKIGGSLSCCDIEAGFVTVGGDICCQKINVSSFNHCHNED